MLFLHEVLLHRSVHTRLLLKHLHLFLGHSFLQPQKLISARAKRAGKFLVIIGANKSFEFSQPYFIKDDKHRDGRYVVLW